jgi:hypothetical protein
MLMNLIEAEGIKKRIPRDFEKISLPWCPTSTSLFWAIVGHMYIRM